MTHDEMIAVIAAHKDGKQIEWRSKKREGRWYAASNVSWSFERFDYRIKPDPRSAEGWMSEKVFEGLYGCSFSDCKVGNPDSKQVRVRVTEIIE